MKLTPLDIRHKEFRRAMRGYSDEEVDVFLDEVADEFERLFQENIEAQERIQRLEEHVAQYEGLKDTLQKTLITAQQQADSLKANSTKEGELILRDAELRARDILSESYTEKQRVQQSLIALKQVEEDFRFKFKSLLEAHLNLLSEDESSEDRRRFRGLVSGVEGDATPAVPEVAPAIEDVAEGPIEAAAGQDRDDALEDLLAGAASETPGSTDQLGEFAPPAADPVAVDTNAPPSFLARSGTDAAAFAFDAESDDDITDAGREPAAADESQSPVRRFLFGKKEKESDEDFFSTKKDRDFEW
jgi:cell division initiation protein